MWLDLQKGVLYTHPIVWLWSGITSFLSKLLDWNFWSCTGNERTVLLPNFKAVGQTKAELCSLKVEKLDACIRPLFANPVTYTLIIIRFINCSHQWSRYFHLCNFRAWIHMCCHEISWHWNFVIVHPYKLSKSSPYTVPYIYKLWTHGNNFQIKECSNRIMLNLHCIWKSTCECKKLLVYSSLFYHNSWTIYANKISLLQNLMGFLLKFMEIPADIVLQERLMAGVLSWKTHSIVYVIIINVMLY